MKIVLVWARPGNGKTLDATRTALSLWRDYRRVEKRYPQLPKRAIWSNMKFSPEVEAEHLGKDLFYWTRPSQLYGLRDVDIIWDDIGIYLPADQWDRVPPQLRKMLIMYRHRGLRIYANTQDYKMVAINFRRMVKRAYMVKKIVGSRDISATRPPVKHVWGVIAKIQFDPDAVETTATSVASVKSVKEKDRFIIAIPEFFLITRELTEAYDTTEELDSRDTGELERLVWEWYDEENQRVGYTKTEYVKVL